ncbi:branched-chain amino acid ABC transporter permease [Blastococcus sp. CT_GayMR20]|uniref:branched-chain amino acid ABC transporter permease n=1 Tax=Blastococcus sp. CT_GayMR20 TaxID=2559609 RepID=UPI0010745235|nr:branched-chain amino acid ABC transporter permease [Blastococcus sp. CT_GayMR20]TFV93785.1 branched-chain amino acid ABC transporter permease [Blastococcus sp. CT_GayMR20]TFV93810.1 branched-chain amino acid ABC transporter permease [Blastococcus sp. CT_GayMR20]
MSTWYYANLVLVQATLTGLLMALSVQVPLRMGVFSFAGVGSYGIGAYAAALMAIHWQLGSLAAIGLAVVLTAVIGLLLGLVIARLAGLYLAMATVAFDLIIGVIAINGGTFTGSSTGLYGVLTDFTMPTMWVLTLIVLGLVVLSEHGKVGRRVHAVRDDQQLAASAGINVRRYRLAAFVVSGALGGLAGALNVMVRTTIGPLDIGFHLIVLALTMIIVGGAMSWKGAVIGAIVFTWLPTFLEFVGEWETLLYGVIVAVAAVLLPRGIHGVFVDITRAIQRRRRKPAAPPPAELEPEPDLEPLMTGPTAGGAQNTSPATGASSSTSLLGGKA